MFERLRRNRKKSAIRDCLSEYNLRPQDFIIPFFVKKHILHPEPILSLPGNYIHSLHSMLDEAQRAYDEGVKCFLLFPIIEQEHKDDEGSFALNEDNIIYEAITALKKHLPESIIMADVALDPYTRHGHDGIVDADLSVDNDLTCQRLILLSLKLASAGVDYVAPSDMMDGRVCLIREALDAEGYTDTGIMSYSAKFASNLYGPFRDTVGSTLKFGDKKSYQLSYHNLKEPLLEAQLDIQEGADLILVKPATLYLDVISKISEASLRPVGAYHVSGEYAMACLLAEKGQLNLIEYLLEVYVSIKRAGAQFIITYGYPVVRNNL